jgi:hypothetical protein
MVMAINYQKSAVSGSEQENLDSKLPGVARKSRTGSNLSPQQQQGAGIVQPIMQGYNVGKDIYNKAFAPPVSPQVAPNAPFSPTDPSVDGGITGISTASATVPESISLDAGVSGLQPTSSTSGVSGIAAPAAYIAAAEGARGMFGGQGKGFDEKTIGERSQDNPGTAGVVGQLLPGMLFSGSDTAGGKIYKNMSRLERQVMRPIDFLFGNKSKDDDTWLCTEISKYVGLTKDDHKALRKLRRYAITNYRSTAKKYFDTGNILVAAINEKEDGHSFYGQLKRDMVQPIIQLVKDDKLEEAYQKYLKDTLALVDEYSPELGV